MTGSTAAGGALLEGHSAGHSTAFAGGGCVLLSRRADHCAFISEMRASLLLHASAWIWEREFARGRLASSLIAATARGVVLSVPALSLCCHQRRVPFSVAAPLFAPPTKSPITAIAVLRSLHRSAFCQVALRLHSFWPAANCRRWTGASLANCAVREATAPLRSAAIEKRGRGRLRAAPPASGQHLH